MSPGAFFGAMGLIAAVAGVALASLALLQRRTAGVART